MGKRDEVKLNEFRCYRRECHCYCLSYTRNMFESSCSTISTYVVVASKIGLYNKSVTTYAEHYANAAYNGCTKDLVAEFGSPSNGQ